MSSLPCGPDRSVERLLADGYVLTVQHGHLLVHRVPYLALDGLRRDGILALPVNDSGGIVTDAIGDHTIWFSGAEPRDPSGSPLGTLQPRDLGGGQTVQYMLSFKPPSGSYASLYDKVRGYARILVHAARSADPDATASPGAAYQVVEDNLPLVYRDTNTTRAGLTDLHNRFRGQVIAIVGVGGTGSYILDQVAKTWVDRVLVIDGDVFENHNAFRAPGAPAHDVLQARRNKAEYFVDAYSRMHTGLRAFPAHLTMENVDLLAEATFVFLAAADAAERPAIMAWLRDHSIPFIDVGLGVTDTGTGLTGLAKVTTYRPSGGLELPSTPTAVPAADDYSTNIQVADLNALNAIMAVIQWKREYGFYATHAPTDESVYKVFVNEIRNGAAT